MGQGSIIGYEINEKTCQISFYNDKEMEPQTLEVDADNFQIPLIISCWKTKRHMGIWKRGKTSCNTERRIYSCPSAFEKSCK